VIHLPAATWEPRPRAPLPPGGLMVPPDAVVPPTMDRRYLEQQELQEQMDQLKRQGETWILDDFGADEPSETN